MNESCPHVNTVPVDGFKVKCIDCGSVHAPKVTAPPSSGLPPLALCMAVSLYTFNVSPLERAVDIAKAMNRVDDQNFVAHLVEKIIDSPAFWATELDVHCAGVYLECALRRYGTEAEERFVINMTGVP